MIVHYSKLKKMISNEQSTTLGTQWATAPILPNQIGPTQLIFYLRTNFLSNLHKKYVPILKNFVQTLFRARRPGNLTLKCTILDPYLFDL